VLVQTGASGAGHYGLTLGSTRHRRSPSWAPNRTRSAACSERRGRRPASRGRDIVGRLTPVLAVAPGASCRARTRWAVTQCG
jgi:hypothetical protein